MQATNRDLLFRSALVATAALALAAAVPAEGGGADTITASFVEQRKPVPFDFGDGHIFFSAVIEGQSLRALLDNRSENNILGINAAKRLGLSLAKGPDLLTPTGAVQRFEIASVAVEIPGQIRFRGPTSSIDLAPISATLDRPLDYIFGREFLARIELIVSSGKQTFYLFPSGSQTPPAQYPMIALDDDRPRISVEINGHPAKVTIDLGFSGQLRVSPAVARRFGLRTDESQATAISDAQGGSMRAEGGRTNMALGSVRAANVQFSIAPNLPEDGDGVLGLGFFRNYDFVLDIQARKLWLAPLSAFDLQ